MLRELKNLKLDLLSDLPRRKKIQLPPPDSEEVERRLAQEAIDEVAGLDHAIETEAAEAQNGGQLLDVIELLKSRDNEFVGFKDVTQGDPSLQRDLVEDLLVVGPSNISIREIVPSDLDLNNLNRPDAFGEATAEEIADAGLFAGPLLGRPLYEGLKNRETMADVARRAAQSLAPMNLTMPEIEIGDPTDPAVLPRTPRTTLNAPIPEVELTGQALLNQTTLALTDFDPVEIVEERPPQAQAAALDEAIQPLRETLRMSRLEFFEKAAQESVAGKPKPRRRRRIRQRRSPSLEDLQFLALNGPLVRHNRKAKNTNARRPEPQLKITMDIFEDLEDYQPDEVVVEDDEIEIEANELEMANRPLAMEADLILVPEVLQNIVDQPMPLEIPEAIAPTKRISESNVTKRRRLNTVEELRDIIGFDENLVQQPQRINQNVESFVEVPDVQTPFVDFIPVSFSTAKTTDIQQITMDDIEFGRLRNVSENRMQNEQIQTLDAPSIAERLGRSKSAAVSRAEAVNGLAGTSSRISRQQNAAPPLRRFVKDGENWIAYEGFGGRTERYTEYNLEVSFEVFPEPYNYYCSFSVSGFVPASPIYYARAQHLEIEARRHH